MFRLKELIEKNIISIEKAEPIEDALDVLDLFEDTTLLDESNEIVTCDVSATDISTELLNASYAAIIAFGKRLGIIFRDDAVLTDMTNILRALYTTFTVDNELKLELYHSIPDDCTRIEALEYILGEYATNEIGIITDTVESITKTGYDVFLELLQVEDTNTIELLDDILRIRDIILKKGLMLDTLPNIISDLSKYRTIGEVPQSVYNKYISDIFWETFVFTITIIELLSDDKYTDYINYVRPFINGEHLEEIDKKYKRML